jgi:glycosyltransferase involved in cell wall biosynthesis
MKGPDLLLEAFARLAARYPHLRLVFAGPDFGMLEQLQRRAAQLCLGERVFFLGLVSGDLRPWLLRNAVCLCQPSRDEGFSLSILEALACARPVVISDRCKFPEVGASGAGCIVPASTSEIAVALDLYIANRVRRECDGTNASRLINQRFTWSIIAGQTAEMYSKIVRTGQLTRGQDRSR